MGNRAKQLVDQGKNVLFAFEEAIGKSRAPWSHDQLIYRMQINGQRFGFGFKD